MLKKNLWVLSLLLAKDLLLSGGDGEGWRTEERITKGSAAKGEQKALQAIHSWGWHEGWW